MKRKVYFAGSIRGGRMDADLYRRMIEYIQKTDTVLTEQVGDLSISLKERGRKGDTEIYERDTSLLKQSDLLIAECTCPSLGVGYELAYAENLGVPCHIFYDRTQTQLSAMLTGDPYFRIYPYSNEEELFIYLHEVLSYPQSCNASPKISIRRVREGDEQSLALIHTESWKAAYRGIMDSETLKRATVPEKSAAMFKQLIKNQVGNGYILEADGQPVCFAWWDKSREEDMNGFAELISIYCLPDQWRHGYGSILITEVLNDITEVGYEKVMLWVLGKNIRALRFYESHGFFRGEKTKNFKDLTELCYIKLLKN